MTFQWPDSRLQRLSDLLRIKAEAFDRSDKDSEARTARMIQDVKKEAKDGEDGMG